MSLGAFQKFCVRGVGKVTDEVMGEVVAWQSRPLESMYPVVFFEAWRVKKIRDGAVVRNKAVYLALGVLLDGTRDVLGIWIEQTEGAKFWLRVFNELRSSGVIDGLNGLAGAIETAFPSTTVQVRDVLRNITAGKESVRCMGIALSSARRTESTRLRTQKI